MLKTPLEIAFRYGKFYKPSVFDSGIGARLPEEYKKFYKEWRYTTPEPVNYRPEQRVWQLNEKTGEMKRFENIPLPAIHSQELNEIFSGGEIIILGFRKKKKYNTRCPRFWMPVCYKSVVYSEILDKYISVILTSRVIELIHKYEGFDNYLLQTSACNLQTLIALKLKRKLLFNLICGELPYDIEKNQVIFQKYEKYLIPLKEIEWYGLSFAEACRKQKEIEERKQKESIVAFKHIFRAQLLEELNNRKE